MARLEAQPAPNMRISKKGMVAIEEGIGWRINWRIVGAAYTATKKEENPFLPQE